MGSERVMDGSNIKSLVENEKAFGQYVEEKFRTLDRTHDGKLSKDELQPVVLAIGSALGLPPKGTSRDSDHIYDEVSGEFLQGKHTSVTKEEFTPILRDMLLGVADGLEREPVVLRTLNGAELESYARSSNFEVDAVAVFSELDKGSNAKLQGSALKQALMKVPVKHGMPPASDPEISRNVIEPALRSTKVHMEKDLSQEEFLTAYRNSLLTIASQMKEKPVTVAHIEKCFDGSTISTFLKNKSAVQQILDDTWASLGRNKGGDGTLPKCNLRLGLDLIAPYAGLPPIGAVNEMDGVVDESFKLVDGDEGGTVSKDEFCKCMLEVLGGIMLQLQGKPIAISSSVPASDSNPEDCLKL